MVAVVVRCVVGVCPASLRENPQDGSRLFNSTTVDKYIQNRENKQSLINQLIKKGPQKRYSIPTASKIFPQPHTLTDLDGNFLNLDPAHTLRRVESWPYPANSQVDQA